MNATGLEGKESLLERFSDVAETALAHYRLGPADIHFLSHSENVAFRVVSKQDSARYLLRIHYPISDHFPPEWRRREAIESELEWLAALNRDTDLIAQQPVRTRNGEWIACISREDIPETLHCTLLHWINGEHPTHITQEQARNIGAMVARVHAHGSQWKRPSGFVRPRYDIQWFRICLKDLAKGIAMGLIAESGYRVIQQAADRLEETMARLGEDGDVWGLIHGDVFDRNMIVHEKGLSPIDFSSCGLGHFALDIASIVLHFAWRDKERAQAILDGYRTVRSLPRDIDRSIAVFPVARILDDLSYIQTRPERHEKMKCELVPCSVEYCRDYLNGRIPLCSDYRFNGPRLMEFIHKSPP